MSFDFIPGKKVDVPKIGSMKEITLPPGETALIIVDMQNDFVKDGGSLKVESAEETVSGIENLIKRCREKGVKIAYTQDTQFPGDPEWEIWPKHCEIHTWGWQIIDELKPSEKDLICAKNRYDGFYGTWLEHFLKNIWDVKNVIIVGTVSNICVLHTAASAGLRWLHVVIPANGISAIDEFGQALTLYQVHSLYAGDVVEDISGIKFE